ncbi:MAG: prepilin peptidase [archaeon]
MLPEMYTTCATMASLGVPLVGIVIGFIAILFAAVCDIRTREVPDWLNYSLLAFAIGNAIILSINSSSWSFILNAAAGLVFGLVIGLSMFYAGQWGGGDSKLIIGLSALIGINISLLLALKAVPLIVIFFVDLMIVGAVYGLGYSLVIAFLNFRKCKDAALEFIKKKEMIALRMIILLLILVSFGNFLLKRSLDSLVWVAFSLLFLFLFYLWLLISIVEKVCMIKQVRISELTEGDWVVNPVMKGKKLLLKPTKTGISRQEIALLKKNKVTGVVIKIGIPFVPSFLIAYVLLFAIGNWLVYFF